MRRQACGGIFAGESRINGGGLPRGADAFSRLLKARDAATEAQLEAVRLQVALGGERMSQDK